MPSSAAAPTVVADPPATRDAADADAPLLDVRDLQMRFGDRLIQEGVSFRIAPGTIFAVMGASGSGKSTLIKHVLGLLQPAGGQVLHRGVDYWAAEAATQKTLRTACGMLFQSAALWSSMTVLENVSLPLEYLTKKTPAEREARAREVLEWVELQDFADYYPEDLSGGMKKRAGLARAIVAEPPLLFLDEPSAGLDPIGSRRLDDLVLAIRERTGAAVLMVSHELPSLLAIADDGIFLDADAKRPAAHGSPRHLRDHCDHPTVHAFLHRKRPPADTAPAPESASPGSGPAAAPAAPRIAAAATP